MPSTPFENISIVLAGTIHSGNIGSAARAVVRPAKNRSFTDYALDSAAVLAAAEGDPEGFVAGRPGPAVIDEVRRALGLALVIKAAVDKDRMPGR